MPTQRSIDAGVALSAFVASGMLAYAIWGQPAYGFFAFLKIIVVAAALACGWRLVIRHGAFLPIVLVLAGLGYVEAFVKMRRADWFPYNAAMIVALWVAGITLALIAIRSKPLEAEAS